MTTFRHLAAAILFAAATTAAAAPGVWTRVGPNTGVFYAARFAPGSSSVALASSEGGVYRSADGGASWSLVLRSPATAQAMAYDPSNPSRAFVAINTGAEVSGVHVTEDGGDSFTHRLSGMSDSFISAIAVSADGARVYAGGANKGVFVSTDHGRSWTLHSAGLPHPTGQAGRLVSINALAVDPADANIVYAASVEGGGVYKSVDGGRNWTVNAGVGGSMPSVYGIAVAPGTPSTLYVSGYSGVSRSTNGGSTWTALPFPGNAGYAIDFDPNAPTTLYASSAFGFIYRSDDRGDSWVRADAGTNAYIVMDLDVSSAAPGRVLAATWQGIFVSADGAVSWTRSSGMLSASIYVMVRDPQTPGTLYAGGGNSGLWKSTDSGRSYFAIDAGLPTAYYGNGGVGIDSMAHSPTTPGTLLVGLWTAVDGNCLQRSLDGGATWQPLGGAAMTSRNIHGLAYAPSDAQVVYAATNLGSSGAVLRSTDGGASWTSVSTGLPATARFGAIAVHPTDPQTVFVGSYTHGAFRSTDGGASWSAMDMGTTWAHFVAVDPRAPYALFVGHSRGLKRSFDDGVSFVDVTPRVSADQNPVINALDFHPTRPNLVLATGLSGAYLSRDIGTHWGGLGSYEIPAYMAYAALFDDSGIERYLLAIESHGVNVLDPMADLSAVLAGSSGGSAAPGAAITAKARIANHGLENAHSVVVTVTFDPTLTQAQVSLPGGTCSVNGNVHECTLAQLDADSVGSELAIDAQTTATGARSVVVSVSSAVSDANLANNGLTWNLTVQGSGSASAGGGGGADPLAVLALAMLGLARRHRMGQSRADGDPGRVA